MPRPLVAGLLIVLALLIGGCGGGTPNPAIESLNAQATVEDVRAVAEADLRSKDWNVPDWYRQSIHITASIRPWLFSDGRSGSYEFIYTGLLASIVLFVIAFIIYLGAIEGFERAYFWLVIGLAVAAIPLLSFGSSALFGLAVPWHFSMFCVFVVGAVGPLLFILLRGLPAFAVAASGAVFGPVAAASRRRAERAEQSRLRRARDQAERQAQAEQALRDNERRKHTKEVAVHEKLRNVELAVGELCLCAADERTAMERDLLHTVMDLTGYERIIRADDEALTNIRTVILMLDKLGYDKDQIVYLKLASLVR